MVVALLPLRLARLVAAPRRDVRLHPDDRLDPRLLRLLLEDPGAEHHPVVRERERRLLELLGARDQVADAVRAVEEGVLRVAVEMDEGHRLPGSENRSGARWRIPSPVMELAPGPAGRKRGKRFSDQGLNMVEGEATEARQGSHAPGKREEGRGKREEGRGKREEGRGGAHPRLTRSSFATPSRIRGEGAGGGQQGPAPSCGAGTLCLLRSCLPRGAQLRGLAGAGELALLSGRRAGASPGPCPCLHEVHLRATRARRGAPPAPACSWRRPRCRRAGRRAPRSRMRALRQKTSAMCIGLLPLGRLAHRLGARRSRPPSRTARRRCRRSGRAPPASSPASPGSGHRVEHAARQLAAGAVDVAEVAWRARRTRRTSRRLIPTYCFGSQVA